MFLMTGTAIGISVVSAVQNTTPQKEVVTVLNPIQTVLVERTTGRFIDPLPSVQMEKFDVVIAALSQEIKSGSLRNQKKRKGKVSNGS